MGTWGTGIYSNDTAEDVRDACKDIFAFYEVEEGNRKIFQYFEELLNQGYVDNEYSSFWYALADWQWKHGMLNDFVKDKTVELLESYSGIDEWNDAGNQRDVIKRKKVLDSLKIRLSTAQPIRRSPRLSLSKPKHDIGEIIVFRASISDECVWKIESFSAPFMFKSPMISNSKFEDVCECNAQGKYMALLCVGTDKELHSEYIPEVYDERSVYVWYDYLSDIEPTLEDLECRGFLPFIDLHWEDFNRNVISGAQWLYKFTLCSEKFKPNDVLSDLKTYNSTKETARFNLLFERKGYSNDIWGGFSLYDMFAVAFEEKNRMAMLGLSVDNLLDLKSVNPEILSPAEINKVYREYLRNLKMF